MTSLKRNAAYTLLKTYSCLFSTFSLPISFSFYCLFIVFLFTVVSICLLFPSFFLSHIIFLHTYLHTCTGMHKYTECREILFFFFFCQISGIKLLGYLILEHINVLFLRKRFFLHINTKPQWHLKNLILTHK